MLKLAFMKRKESSSDGSAFPPLNVSVEALIDRLISARSQDLFDRDLFDRTLADITRAGKSAVGPLIGLVQSRTIDYRVRTEAIHALREIGDRRAVEPLVALLGDANFYVRNAAASALRMHAVRSFRWEPKSEIDKIMYFCAAGDYREAARSGPGALIPLMANLEEAGHEYDGFSAERIESIASALGDLGDPQAVMPLLDVLATCRFRDARAAVISALGSIGDVRAIKPLFDLLTEDEHLAKEAHDALIEILKRRPSNVSVAEIQKLAETHPYAYIPYEYSDGFLRPLGRVTSDTGDVARLAKEILSNHSE